MPIEAIVGSQNGISPPDSLYTRPSPHILIANTTTIVYSQGVYFRCINTAPYPKDLPATFYSEVTTGTTTSTISLGQAYFDGVTATLYTTLLGSGTNRVSVTWPGESRYEGFTTTMVNSISVASAFPYPGTLTFSATPSTTNQLLNPTGTLHLSSGTSITGNIRILQNGTSSQTVIQTVSVNNTNTVKFSLNPNLFIKTANNQYQLQAIWDGGFVNSIPYYGTSSNVITQIVTTGTLTLRGPTVNLIRYPSIFTATANTSLVTTATVKFLDGPNVIGQVTTIGNSATISISSGTLNSGSHVISALWYGSSPSVVSNNFTTTIVPIGNTIPNVSLTTPLFRQYNQNRTVNTLTSVYVSVSGIYPSHLPTGRITLKDGPITLTSSTTIPSMLYWNPSSAGELDAGPRTLTLNYSGDDWNNSSSSTATFRALTKGFITSSTISASNTSYYFMPTSFTVDLHGGLPTGSVVVQDTTGTLVAGSINQSGPNLGKFISSPIYLSPGTHTVQGQVAADTILESTVTNSLTFTLGSLTPSITDIVVDPLGTRDWSTIQFRIPQFENVPTQYLTNGNITINLYSCIARRDYAGQIPEANINYPVVGGLYGSYSIPIGQYSTGTNYTFTATDYRATLDSYNNLLENNLSNISDGNSWVNGYYGQTGNAIPDGTVQSPISSSSLWNQPSTSRSMHMLQYDRNFKLLTNNRTGAYPGTGTYQPTKVYDGFLHNLFYIEITYSGQYGINPVKVSGVPFVVHNPGYPSSTGPTGATTPYVIFHQQILPFQTIF